MTNSLLIPHRRLLAAGLLAGTSVLAATGTAQAATPAPDAESAPAATVPSSADTTPVEVSPSAIPAAYLPERPRRTSYVDVLL